MVRTKNVCLRLKYPKTDMQTGKSLIITVAIKFVTQTASRVK